MKLAICSSKTSDATRPIPRNFPIDIIFHGHRREELKSYNNYQRFERNYAQIPEYSGSMK
jgi:hypothetical protein